jgi:hypothetical protein
MAYSRDGIDLDLFVFKWKTYCILRVVLFGIREALPNVITPLLITTKLARYVSGLSFECICFNIRIYSENCSLHQFIPLKGGALFSTEGTMSLFNVTSLNNVSPNVSRSTI